VHRRDPLEAFEVEALETPSDRKTRSQAGKRSYSRTDRKRGRYVQARPARQKPQDIAFDATLRAAAPFQKTRKKKGTAFAIESPDLQEKVRVRRASNLILFAVDASWSMSAVQRMRATKGAILSLLVDAYQRRDQVGLVVFSGRKANLVLPPTSSVELAQKALADLPIGGRTPLSAGLMLSHQILVRHKKSNPEVRPLLILLTDGIGNVSVSGRTPDEEARQIARNIRAQRIQSVVINMGNPSVETGQARALAGALGAPCHSEADLHAEKLYRKVKAEFG